jgi:hypothetical protein
LVTPFHIEPPPSFHFRPAGKIIGGQDLSWHQRQGDGPLVEPAGLERGLHHKRMGRRRAHALDGGLTTRRRPVRDHPKAPLGRPVGRRCQHRRDPPAQRCKAGARLATPPHLPSPDRPGCQIWPGTTPVVRALDTPRSAGCQSPAGVTPLAGWEARLVIGTAAVITGPEAVAVPNPRLPIQHHGGVRGTQQGARADPGRLDIMTSEG